MLLVQERSSSVINAARQLAVIPKGFHQPMADYRNDARIAATLLREAEEELFGRTDIDGTLGEQHAADPMHPARLSEPMRWLLTEEPGALRMECTGFGLNLVSGNFEFACLIVIDSDEFWTRFGGHIEANWESSTLSLPSDGRPPQPDSAGRVRPRASPGMPKDGRRALWFPGPAPRGKKRSASLLGGGPASGGTAVD
jgi:hypothetical protein